MYACAHACARVLVHICVCLCAWSAQWNDPRSGRARLEFKGEAHTGPRPQQEHRSRGYSLSCAGLAADLGVEFGGLVGMLDELARIEPEKLRARVGLC